MPFKNIIPGQTVTKEKLRRAKELRRDMTPAEKILWQELSANKLGVHFRRQQVVNGLTDINGRAAQVLSEMGLRIVRFRNEEVMKNLAGVVSFLCSLLV